MTATSGTLFLGTPRLVALCTTWFLLFLAPAVQAGPKPESYWQVDDVRPGMKGKGRTVMNGTKIEPFDAEVLGVLKNTSPGRDMVLCRLSGLNLEKTGIIAGMSGSPVYIDGKLLGAVAYAWPFGKEPIAGVTPFVQMHSFVEAFERRDLAEEQHSTRVGLRSPLTIDGKQFESVTVAASPDAANDDGLCMVPLSTPLSATGFSAHSLGLLRDQLKGSGLVPVQGGGASARVLQDEKNIPLEPGGALAVAMIRGDFDLSGIGTVTHIEGNRVYGWGHPYMTLGDCDLPLMTGYIHTVYPRQSVSFKMGSPLQTVGVINADVSTCIAGWLGRKPDMMPMKITVEKEAGNVRTFNVELVRQRSLLSALVFSALINSVDMEGDLPDEMTADLEARIEVEGHDTVILKDTYSGPSYSGGRAPQNLFNQVTSLVGYLAGNSYKPVRITRIECSTRIRPGRKTADVESVELNADTYAPGDTIKATLLVRPYRGTRQRLTLELKLPTDLPEGSYTATLCDDLTEARQEFRENPNLTNPQNVEQVLQALKVQTTARRTNLVLRIPLPAVGVALEGKSLPNLPPGMVQVLGNNHRGSAQTMSGALVTRQATEWVFQGSDAVRFTVARNKNTLNRD